MRRNAPGGAGVLLAAAVVVGVFGDLLLRDGSEDAPRGPWGASFPLWVSLVVAAVWWHFRPSRRSGSAEAVGLLAGALALAAILAWRDAVPLKLLGVGLTGGLLALAAYRVGASWLRRAGVLDYATAGLYSAWNVAIGAGALALSVGGQSGSEDAGRRRSRRLVATAVRGLVLALPLVLVFGGLFFAADAVFASLVSKALRFDLEIAMEHLVVTGFLAWVVAGYLRAFGGAPAPTLLSQLSNRAPRLGLGEAGVALGLLNVLFLSFLLVQARFLFGGSGHVEVTPGLTYAEYARSGFFELLAVTALVVPLLLLAEHAVRRDGARDERVFRLLASGLVLMLFAIVASALQRLRLYLEAFGWTEARLYAAALMLWLAAVLAWLLATVLRGRRNRFAFGALVAGCITVVVLALFNPDARIAATNLERTVQGHRFDARYAGRLSADAVPTLVGGLDRLGVEDRCTVAAALLARSELLEARADWRDWSVSTTRARRLLREHSSDLREVAGGCASRR